MQLEWETTLPFILLPFLSDLCMNIWWNFSQNDIFCNVFIYVLKEINDGNMHSEDKMEISACFCLELQGCEIPTKH